MTEYSIGQVAAAAGLAPSAIRYYERRGLIPKPMRRSGHRRYSQEIFARLALIQMCKRLGFELAEVELLVIGLKNRDRSTKQFRQLAANEAEKVEKSIEQAQRIQSLLAKAIACNCATLEECALRHERAGCSRVCCDRESGGPSELARTRECP